MSIIVNVTVTIIIWRLLISEESILPQWWLVKHLVYLIIYFRKILKADDLSIIHGYSTWCRLQVINPTMVH